MGDCTKTHVAAKGATTASKKTKKKKKHGRKGNGCGLAESKNTPSSKLKSGQNLHHQKRTNQSVCQAEVIFPSMFKGADDPTTAGTTWHCVGRVLGIFVAEGKGQPREAGACGGAGKNQRAAAPRMFLCRLLQAKVVPARLWSVLTPLRLGTFLFV